MGLICAIAMEPFLRRVARLLLADHGRELAEVAVVLPSQRAGLYLRRHLAQLAGTTVWSPSVMTLTGLLERVSGLKVAATTDLLFEAYEAYRTVEGDRASGFSDLLQWGPTALRDMSEVDAHLIPLDTFYRDLRNWEELDWSFNDDASPFSPGQQRMMRYWAMKGALHRHLNERLLAKGTGTGGLVGRVAAEKARAEGGITGLTKVWAVGLNALTPCEREVLLALQRAGHLEIAWDADRYYLDDADQEAGDSLRSAMRLLGPGRIAAIDGLTTTERPVEVATVPNTVAQVHLAAMHLSALSPEELDRTAVVLADEQLLLPLLDVLPAGIGKVNVTMGLPLHALPVGSLLTGVIELHRSYRPGRGHRVSDVDRLLRHPLLLRGGNAGGISAALDTLHAARRTHLPVEQVLAAMDALGPDARLRARALLEAPVRDGAALGDRLLEAIAWAAEVSPEDALAQEQLFLAARAEQRIRTLVRQHHQVLDLDGFSVVHQRLLREERVGLFGEPLEGVQVMGLLETRALDLDRIVVLSAQEGILPPANTDRSFIPFEIRRAHRLPLRQEHDAVAAYNFWRMVQHARNVTLAMAAGEGAQGPSRYILQLEHELAPRSRTTVTQRTLQAPVPVRSAIPLAVAKDDRVLAAMRALLERGLSPSAIGQWLQCPMDLHLRRVLELKETDTATAMIPHDLLGTAVHEAMEEAYRPLLGRALDADGIGAVHRALPRILRRHLEQAVGADALAHGQPLLQHAMAEQAVLGYVEAELERVTKEGGTVVEALELDLRVPLPGALERHGSAVQLHGRVDRIERRNGRTVILDLKSGSVQKDQVRLRSLLFEELRPDKDRYALQLLVYGYMYLMANPDADGVLAGLVPLQRRSDAAGLFLEVQGVRGLSRAQLPAVEELLHACITRMLDPSVSIAHRPESTRCRFCAG